VFTKDPIYFPNVPRYLNTVLDVFIFVNNDITRWRMNFTILWNTTVENRVIQDLNIVNICFYKYKGPIYFPNVPSYLNIVLDVFIFVNNDITRLRMSFTILTNITVQNRIIWDLNIVNLLIFLHNAKLYYEGQSSEVKLTLSVTLGSSQTRKWSLSPTNVGILTIQSG